MRERTCIGCRKTQTKQELFRIARTPDGAVVFDRTGKGPGRGAYVCSVACFEDACKKGRIAAALRCKVSADEHAEIENGLRSAVSADGCEG